VAFWGAPIARADDADRALAAVNAMVAAGEAFRRSAPPGIPPIGRTRVGLHRGEAVVGNFGGEGRIQYTALGDAMNTAARLESANKKLGTRALVSAEAASGMTNASLRPMGRVAVRGRSTPIEVFEPVDSVDPELTRLVGQVDSGNEGALAELEAYAASRGDDAALEKLVFRMRSSGPGGYVALD
jgi:adenylate cyclase